MSTGYSAVAGKPFTAHVLAESQTGRHAIKSLVGGVTANFSTYHEQRAEVLLATVKTRSQGTSMTIVEIQIFRQWLSNECLVNSAFLKGEVTAFTKGVILSGRPHHHDTELIIRGSKTPILMLDLKKATFNPASDVLVTDLEGACARLAGDKNAMRRRKLRDMWHGVELDSKHLLIVALIPLTRDEPHAYTVVVPLEL